MISKNYYEILGLNNDCTAQDIKKSYHQLALIWHPDKHVNKKEAELEFTFINEAYTVLSDVISRNLYDNQRMKSSELEQSFKEFSNEFDTSTFQMKKFTGLDKSTLDILKNLLEDQDEVESNIKYKNSEMTKGLNSTIKSFINQEIISSEDEYIFSEYQPTFMNKNFYNQFTIFSNFYQTGDDSNQYFATIIEDVPEKSVPHRRKSSIIIIEKAKKQPTSNESSKPINKKLSKSKKSILRLNTGFKRSFIYNEEMDNVLEEHPQKRVKRPQVKARLPYFSELSATDNETKLNLKSIFTGNRISLTSNQDPITTNLSLKDLRKRLQSQN